MTTNMPALVCVDVEPDTRMPDLNSRGGWKGFEESLRLFGELRHGAGVGVSFNWFLRMDPQVELAYGSAIWAAERYGAQLEALRGAGDEVGLHTHAWRRVGGGWVADHGDQAWVNHCVRVSFDAYESAFGRACRSFRFGDRWMNDETFGLVESLGARYELTLEPGRRPPSNAPSDGDCTGRFPDYAKVPREPYRPAREDFRARGERDVWVIPVSTSLLPHWPDAPLYRRVVWRARYGRRTYEALSLALDPVEFRHTFNAIVGGGSARHLCVVVRTDAAAERAGAERLRENLGLLLSHAADGRLELTTPARLVRRTNGLTTSRGGT